MHAPLAGGSWKLHPKLPRGKRDSAGVQMYPAAGTLTAVSP